MQENKSFAIFFGQVTMLSQFLKLKLHLRLCAVSLWLHVNHQFVCIYIIKKYRVNII